MMRSFVSRFAASAAFTIGILTSFGVPAQPTADRRVACAALSAAEPAKVIEACTALIDNPATPQADRLDATITRAAALQNSGQTAKALADIDTVIAKDPNRARAFRARGEILRQTGKMEAAFEALNQAIRLEPDNANGYANRGNAFNNAKKYDRAIEDYNEALRLQPDLAQVFSDRGAAWYFKGEYQRAIADYDEALRLEPHRARTYSNRSAAYRKLGRAERAIEDVSAAIRIDPTQPEFFDNRGLDLAGNGDYARAIADYDEAIKDPPRAEIPDQPWRRLSGEEGLRPCHRGLRRGVETRSEIPARLQQPRRGLGQARATAAVRCRIMPRPSVSTLPTAPPPPITRTWRRKSNGWARCPTRRTCRASIAPPRNARSKRRSAPTPGLAQLDRNINDVFLRVIASAEFDSHRAALALTRQQRDFIEKRNSSFGKRGYDLRQAMEDRLEKLNTIARQ